MPFAENFHPEWGVLAPAPSFMRTVRVVLVATAIGATAGAAAVITLMDRPGPDAGKSVPAGPAMATTLATTPRAAPSDSATSAASAALSELNSAAAAPAKIEVSLGDDAAATPQASEPAPASQPLVATLAAKENRAEKAGGKKRHKTVHRRHRIQDASAERRFDRGYNTAYRQW